MTNLYLLVYSPTQFKNEQLAKYLDSKDWAKDWFFSMPNSMFIASDLSPGKIGEELQTRFGQFRHFITLVSKTYAGRLPTEHWDPLKKHVSK